MRKILNNHPIYYNEDCDLFGKILKLYSSCCNYHCEKILKNIENRIERQIKDLSNSPILYIIMLLRYKITENKDMIKKLNIEDHILINWKSIKLIGYDPECDREGLNLFKLENYEEEKKIFSCLESKWDIVVSRIDKEYYSVKFKSYIEYNRFKEYALKLSKPYYIFEGDVLDLIRIEREYNGII